MILKNFRADNCFATTRPIRRMQKRFPIRALMLGFLTFAATFSFVRASNAAVMGKLILRNSTKHVVRVDIALDSDLDRDFENYAILSPGQSVTLAMNHPDASFANIRAEYQDAAGSWHNDWGSEYFANDPERPTAWTWNIGAPDSDQNEGIHVVVGGKG